MSTASSLKQNLGSRSAKTKALPYRAPPLAKALSTPADTANFCSPQKKRENFKLATQSEALEKKVAALEKESGVLKDENKACKKELTALKAKVEMEKELLNDEKKACRKEVSALKATLEDKLVAQGKEEADGSIDNQVKQGGGADAGDAKAGPGQE